MSADLSLAATGLVTVGIALQFWALVEIGVAWRRCRFVPYRVYALNYAGVFCVLGPILCPVMHG